MSRLRITPEELTALTDALRLAGAKYTAEADLLRAGTAMEQLAVLKGDIPRPTLDTPTRILAEQWDQKADAVLDLARTLEAADAIMIHVEEKTGGATS